MAEQIYLTIKTPTKIIFEGNVKQITMPALLGKITVLPNHSNLVTLIDIGLIEVEADTDLEFFCIKGLARIQKNHVTILTEEVAKLEQEVLNEISAAIESAKKGQPTSVILTEDLIRAEKELRYILLKDK
jgi:F-type H+-transporting ATPase subunit epsilon